MGPTKYYGLLYVDEVRNRNTNLAWRGDPVDIYLSCACLCAKTFRSAGESFCLVTNSAREVQRRLDDLELSDLPVVTYPFSLPVPEGLPFYSAHFKLDLFRAFGLGDFGDHVGFVDLDTVLLKRLPTCSALGVYDISDQVLPVHDRARIIADIKKISGRLISDARWYGGEFVTGSAGMFRIISSHVETFWETYIQNVSSLGHVGDEMVLSAAINFARHDGVPITDYGMNCLVARWWSARTRHEQPPFDAVKKAALLHLPADKTFLARQAQYPFDRDSFLTKFRPYVRRKCLSRRILHFSQALLPRPKQFLPRLTEVGICK